MQSIYIIYKLNREIFSKSIFVGIRFIVKYNLCFIRRYNSYDHFRRFIPTAKKPAPEKQSKTILGQRHFYIIIV